MANSQLSSDLIDGSTTAGLVHDLGNLIQIASSAVRLLAARPGRRSAETRAAVTRAQASLSRAGALVRQSMLRATEMRRDVVELEGCLTELAALASLTWDRRYDLRVCLTAGLPRVVCDPIALQSAVLNLLLNARDAMPDGGAIALTASPTSEATHVEISVADNGIGMTGDTIRRAFEPFFTTKADGLGGLGLPMAQRFAREAGGDVAVESRPGVGTIVTLSLPASSH